MLIRVHFCTQAKARHKRPGIVEISRLLELVCVVEVRSRVLGVTPWERILQPQAIHPKRAPADPPGRWGLSRFRRNALAAKILAGFARTIPTSGSPDPTLADAAAPACPARPAIDRRQTNRRDYRRDSNRMPTKPLDLPIKVAQAFARDMRAFEAKTQLEQDEIASRQLHALQAFQRPRDKRRRLADVKQMFLEMRDMK